MFRKLWVALIILTLIGVGGGLGWAYTEEWSSDFEAVPADNDQASEGAQRIRNLKLDVRERLEDEHDWGTPNLTDTGVHLEGSARCWMQDAEPASTPGGLTIDNGSLWYETDESKWYVYDFDDTAWELIVDGDDNVTLTTEQTIIGVKTLTRVRFAAQAVTAATYTVGTDYNLYFCDTTDNAITLDLPTAASITGEIIAIKLVDATNALTIDPDGAETLDGASTRVLSILNDFVIIASDGTNWRVIAGLVVNSVSEPMLTQALRDKFNRWSIFDNFGGDGSDGDLEQDSGTTTISDADSDGLVVVQYGDLTLTNNVGPGIFTTTGKTLLLGVKGTLTIENGAYITMYEKGASGGAGGGNDGSDGGWLIAIPLTGVIPATTVPSQFSMAGGGGGGGGSSAPSVTGGVGGIAGAIGGAGSAAPNTGAAGSSPSAAKEGYKTEFTDLVLDDMPTTNYVTEFLHQLIWSRGAGGGGGYVAGGDGGGGIYIEADTLDISGSAIEAPGGVGDSTATSLKGGGGGGGGGIVIVLYKNLTNGTVANLSAVGGAGGFGGANGGDGGVGGAGTIYLIDVDG